jgi:DNA-binding HxlR family transcriptional regulator
LADSNRGEARDTRRRQYGQFCGLAAALDIVGERWTLLVVRELLIGPARFNDLLNNLPGIGPNLLTARLQTLQSAGLVAQLRVSGDGRGRLYALTERGNELRDAVLALAHWGMRVLGEEDAKRDECRADWGFLAVQAMIRDADVPDIDEVYEFRIDDRIFHITVRHGTATAERGPGKEPALVAHTDATTFVKIGAQLVSPLAAVLVGDLKITGDAEAIQRCTALLGLTER